MSQKLGVYVDILYECICTHECTCTHVSVIALALYTNMVYDRILYVNSGLNISMKVLLMTSVHTDLTLFTFSMKTHH